jgi:hypothetical protein
MKLRTLASAPVIIALLLAVSLTVVWAASLPVDDPYSTSNQQWNGTSELTKLSFTPTTSDLTSTLSSPTTPTLLLIDGPSAQFTQADAVAIRSFVNGGGVVVVADNFGSGNGLLDLLGGPVRFDGRVLLDPLFYSKDPNYPLMFNLPSSDLSANVDKDVLNYATILSIQPGSGVKVLGSSSPFSFLDVNKNGQKDSAEPSGSFPVLAEYAVGQGEMILFSSPASFDNDLIHEVDNSVLLGNIVKLAAQPNQRATDFLDQSHLQPSPFTPAKLATKALATEVLSGGMDLMVKLGLVAVAFVVVVARYAYKRPAPPAQLKKREPERSPLLEVESVLRLHPTWDRKKLEYVAREIEATSKWRRLREQP